MQGVVYVLFLFLCEGECVLSMSCIGPGLVSMSPPSSRSNFKECLFDMLGMLFLLVKWF